MILVTFMIVLMVKGFFCRLDIALSLFVLKASFSEGDIRVRLFPRGTPLNGLCRYVQPQRVGFFRRFGHK